MSNLTKTLLLSIVLASSATAWATVIASGATVNQGGTGGATACAALNNADTVRVSVSANNGAAYECNAANVGVAVASSRGRGIIYYIHSQGGNTIVAVPNGARFASVAAAEAAADTNAGTALDAAGT